MITPPDNRGHPAARREINDGPASPYSCCCTGTDRGPSCGRQTGGPSSPRPIPCRPNHDDANQKKWDDAIFQLIEDNLPSCSTPVRCSCPGVVARSTCSAALLL